MYNMYFMDMCIVNYIYLVILDILVANSKKKAGNQSLKVYFNKKVLIHYLNKSKDKQVKFFVEMRIV